MCMFTFVCFSPYLFHKYFSDDDVSSELIEENGIKYSFAVYKKQ